MFNYIYLNVNSRRYLSTPLGGILKCGYAQLSSTPILNPEFWYYLKDLSEQSWMRSLLNPISINKSSGINTFY